jgi:hypothetical protein
VIVIVVVVVVVVVSALLVVILVVVVNIRQVLLSFYNREEIICPVMAFRSLQN